MNFLQTLSPVVQVMLALGVALAAATRLTRRSSWARQVSSWWRLMPAVFLAWALGPWGVKALWLLVGALAVRELAPHAADARSVGQRLWAAWLLLGLAGVAAPWLAVACGGALALAAFVAHRERHDASTLLPALFGLQAAGLGCLVLLAERPTTPAPQGAWFFYVCTVTALNDIGQFVVGKLWGRSALATSISPNKTWQGAGGGLAISIVVSVLVGSALGLASIAALAGLGVLLCVVGIVGDLLFSAAKRALRIKDFSELIPGHGGILDRVDSLVLTAPTLLATLLLTSRHP